MPARISVHRSATAVLVLTAGPILLLAGCGSTGAATTTPAVLTLHASEAEDVSSMEEVAANSSTAVYFTAGQSHVEVVQDLPFTVTTVTVTQSMDAGVPAGATLDIRQTGQVGKVVVDGDPEILETGTAYAGFLSPFHFVQGDDTGQWTITGDGLWRDLEGAILRTTSDETTLPEQLTDTELREAASE